MTVVRVEEIGRASARSRPESNVGLHLPTGDHLLPADRQRQWWKEHGHAGQREVVCLDCHTAGIGDAWLVFVEGSQRRAHLRHLRPQPGTPSVHATETWWHLSAKSRLAAWAATLPNVAEVHVEHQIPGAGDHGRRPDVMVLADGDWVTLEIQQSPLAATEWLQRSSDARDSGYLPVWLFAPHNRPLLDRAAQMDARSCLIFDLELDEVGLMVRKAAVRGAWWWEDPEKDLSVYLDRAARPGDRPDRTFWVPLEECGLSPTAGVVLPADSVPSEDVTELAREAESRRDDVRLRRQRQDALAKAARERPSWRRDEVYSGDVPLGYVPSRGRSRLCVLCGLELSEFYGPDEDRHLPFYECHRYRDW
ncbi:MAG: competence protein CoiA family protein [Aeromicrobium sp.]|uniref:competence protein CoiA family protein n=1 Tax=Aeromicrobium sp. TaxID=1871063 RepID=UPI002621DF2B|nr:competence protein CoiA family protein [Aeromicrobium sp.]MDF1705827.1 competence protein CoiA family protein [Aeromicrobium sp.]